MGIPHGIFNKSEQPTKCFFWVTPTRALYDLFWAIHSMKEQKPDEVVALAAKHEVVFLPPPPGQQSARGMKRSAMRRCCPRGDPNFAHLLRSCVRPPC
jgi:hypothetical protein